MHPEIDAKLRRLEKAHKGLIRHAGSIKMDIETALQAAEAVSHLTKSVKLNNGLLPAEQRSHEEICALSSMANAANAAADSLRTTLRWLTREASTRQIVYSEFGRALTGLQGIMLDPPDRIVWWQRLRRIFSRKAVAKEEKVKVAKVAEK